MKKIFVLFFLLLGFEFCGVAQNRYWNHLAQYIPHPEHCVPIMHSDGFVYYCQSMNYLLSVAKLNSNTMFPMQDMTWELFDNQANMIFYFQLHGGFENASGELVLYGYDDVEMCAAICVVNFSIQDTKYLLFQSPIVSTGALIEGCNGHDIHGDEVYLFVDENGRIISMIPFLSSGNTAIVKPTPYNFYPAGKFTDISWDGTHQCFIASGTNYHGNVCFSNPFVDIFRVDISTSLLQKIPVTTYSLDNGFFVDVSEAKAKHSILDSEHLILYHDLRDDCHDIIWLTLIKDFWSSNYVVIKSKAFLIPTHKMDVVDMLYDNFNCRLNFLGRLENSGFSFFFCTAGSFFVKQHKWTTIDRRSDCFNNWIFMLVSDFLFK